MANPKENGHFVKPFPEGSFDVSRPKSSKGAVTKLEEGYARLDPDSSTNGTGPSANGMASEKDMIARSTNQLPSYNPNELSEQTRQFERRVAPRGDTLEKDR